MKKETVVELIRLLVESRLQEVAGPLVVKNESQSEVISDVDDIVFSLDVADLFKECLQEHMIEYVEENKETFKKLLDAMGFICDGEHGVLFIRPSQEIMELFDAVGYMLMQKGERVLLACKLEKENPNRRLICFKCGACASHEEDRVDGLCRFCHDNRTVIQVRNFCGAWFTIKE